ncbi:MAG: GNAT family N-acetyltransferase [Leucobacter sp.]
MSGGPALRGGGLRLRLARPDEYEAVDRLVAEAYAHDYGPSDESGDPMRHAEVRAREFEVWVAVDEAGGDVSVGLADDGGYASARDKASSDAGASADAGAATDPAAGLAAGAGPRADGDLAPGADADPGALLGSITLRTAGGPPLHEDFGPDELDLRLLAVSPLARRRGIGAALMHQATIRAEEGGFDAVALKTAPNMSGAHRLYEALGYRRAPERDGLWVDGEKVLDLRTYLRAVRD